MSKLKYAFLALADSPFVIDWLRFCAFDNDDNDKMLILMLIMMNIMMMIANN